MPMKQTAGSPCSKYGGRLVFTVIFCIMMSGMNRVFAVGDYQNQLTGKAKAYRTLQREKQHATFHGANDCHQWKWRNSNAAKHEVELEFGMAFRLQWYARLRGRNTFKVGIWAEMQWFSMPFIGFDWRYRRLGIDEHEKNLFGQRNEKDYRRLASLSIRCRWWLTSRQRYITVPGIVRLRMMREDFHHIQKVSWLYGVNTDFEYMGNLIYIISSKTSARTATEMSDMGWGVGLSW